MGKPLREAVPELLTQGIVALLERVYATGEPLHMTEVEVSFATPEGALRCGWFNSVTLPMRTSAGAIDGVMTFSFDVTDLVLARKRAEEAADRVARLQAATAALSRVQRTGDVAEVIVAEGVAALRADTGSLYLRNACADGMDLVAVRGVAPALVAQLRHIPISSAANPGAVVASTGEAMWVETHAEYEAVSPDLAQTAVDGPRAKALCCLPVEVGGAVAGVLGFGFYDEHRFSEDERALIVTLGRQCSQAVERAQLHEREQRAARRLRILSDASRVVASSLDYDTTLSNLASVLVPELADWSAVEILDEGSVPRVVAIAHTDPDKAAAAHALRREYPHDPSATMGVMNVLRTGKSELYADVTDATLTAAARDERHLAMVRALEMHSIMVVPLRAGGRALGTLTLVSGRGSRRYDTSDLAFAEELASRAAVAVANAQLHRETREAMRGREEFLSVASHELNTPLTSLRLLVEMLRRPGADAGKTAKRIEHVERQVLRMTSLVHDLLDVSRIVGGHLALTLERVDLAAVVRDVASRFEGGAVPFHLRVDEGAVGLWDALRVEQVVTNLLGNAVKYGEGRAVDVAVAVDAARGKATLTVVDHGIGIAPENQARIFQKFERAVSVRHFGGFGLGLWITRQAVVALGGTVRVVSAQGEGSTFEVELPLQGPTEASA